jgi:hypothetical protein
LLGTTEFEFEGASVIFFTRLLQILAPLRLHSSLESSEKTISYSLHRE